MLEGLEQARPDPAVHFVGDAVAGVLAAERTELSDQPRRILEVVHELDQHVRQHLLLLLPRVVSKQRLRLGITLEQNVVEPVSELWFTLDDQLNPVIKKGG